MFDFRAGYNVSVWNRAALKAEPLARAGACVFEYADEAVAASELTLALEDALKTYRKLDAPAEFIQLMRDRAKSALDDGLGEKQLTALVAHMAG